MSSMFANSKVTELDVSSFNTSNVTSMEAMFSNSKATVLDLSSFDTSKVTDMKHMFLRASATKGYARTQADVDRLNSSEGKPTTLNFKIRK